MQGQKYIYTDRSGKKHIQIVCSREIDVGEEIHYDNKGEYMEWRAVTQNVKTTARKETSTPPTLDVPKSLISDSELPKSTAPADETEKPPFLKLGRKLSKTVNFDVQGLPHLHLEESPLSTVTSRDCVSLATTFDNEKPLASPKPLHLSKDFTSTTKKPKTTDRPPQTSSSKTVQKIVKKNTNYLYQPPFFVPPLQLSHDRGT